MNPLPRPYPNIKPSVPAKVKTLPSVQPAAAKPVSTLVGGQGANGPHQLAAMIQAHQFGNVAMQGGGVGGMRRRPNVVSMPPGMPMSSAGMRRAYVGS